MKLLLINPSIREWAEPNVFPSGLGYIAAALKERRPDWEVEVYDVNALRPPREEVEAFIRDAEFDVVGTGGIVTIYKYIKWLLGVIRKHHPDKKIVVGGSCATSIPQTMMDHTEADILCIGEGENTAVEMLDAIESGKPLDGVAGIWFRDADGEIRRTPPRTPIKNLDTLPHPLWDIFPMDVYVTNPIGAVNLNKWDDGKQSGGDAKKSMNVLSSRGCPYKCTFCYHDFMGAAYRHRSAENIFDEISTLKEKYGVDYIHFIDNCFIINRKNVMRFCDLMIGSNMKVEWGCAGRVNIMTEELIAKMREAGCVFIGYGIESGSQKMLDRMKKKVTVEQAKNAIRLTQKHLGWADCSFIVGMPGETRETLRETVDFCKELNLAPEVIFFATPYPGTELYQIARDAGKIPDEEAFVSSLGEQGEKARVNFTDFSDGELTRLKEEMVRELGAWNKRVHGEES
ncbi:MAG: radical SAM protein [bacterium]